MKHAVSRVRALSLIQQPPFGITGNKNIIINGDDDGSSEGPPHGPDVIVQGFVQAQNRNCIKSSVMQILQNNK